MKALPDKYPNIPRPIRIVIGVVVGGLVILLSPLLALIRPDWKYIILKVWDEVACSWAYGVKELCRAAVKNNLWFSK